MKLRRLASFVPILLTGLILVPGWFMLAANVGADAIITVNSTFDDTLANLSGNGTCDLREAIAAANTDTAVGECTAGNGIDTITFDASLTAETDAYVIIMAHDTGLDDGEYGPSAFLITSMMTIQGPGTENGVLLWGSFGNSERRLFHVMPGGNLTLENLTLTKGIARGGDGGGGNAGGGGAAGMGGAILNEGTLNIVRTTFSENAAYGGHGHPNQSDYGSGGGGGTGQDGQDEQNDPGGAGGGPNGGAAGGAVGGDGGDGGNGGGGGGGGGGWCACTHTAGDGGNGGFGGGGGGGGHALATGGGTQATGGNGGDGGFGGGGGGAGSAESGSGSGNWAGSPGTAGFGGGDGQSAGTGSANVGGAGGGGAGMGGAIFNHGGTVTVESSTFSGNLAWGGSSYDPEGSSQFDNGGPGDGYGGAIFNRNGTITIANSTLVSNTVVAGQGNGSGTAAGGGVYSLGDGATATLALSNTIVANSASANTEIQLMSDYVLVMGSLSSTTDVVGNAINVGTNASSGANNQIESQSGFAGGIVSTADPDLGPLQDNTGPTYTHAPNIGSPVIDAGSCGGVDTDQRGVTRPLDGEPNGSVVCDIGAVEFDPNLDPVVPPDGDENLLGNRLRLSDMGPDGNSSYSANRPAVAYNSTDNEYLVVWYGDDNNAPLVDNEWEIFGQWVDGTTGAEIGGDFRISDMGPDGSNSYGAFYPRVAYNATDNEYLVVWYGDDNTGSLVDGEFEIFGQRIDGATGAEVGGDFRISDMGSTDGSTTYNAQYPDVVWNATNNQYLVVWQGDDDSGSLADNEFEIYGQLINGATGAEIGGDFRISDMGPDGNGSYDGQYVRAAWNSTNNEYLVVWQGDDDGGSLVDNEFEIYGQRLNGATGAEIGGDFRISDMGPDGNTNYTAAGWGNPPAVAYNPIDNEYLVIWQGDDNTGSLVDNEREIFGQRLDAATGAQVGGNDFRISDVGIDTNTSYGASNPSVAYDALHHEYLAVWHADEFRPPLVTDNEQEIYGQRLNASSGAEAGDNDFRISKMGPDNDNTYNAFYPDVAANSSNAEYLIVWQGDDDTPPLVDNEYEIYGQRYGVPFSPTPILSVRKTASDSNPTWGDVLTYTVLIHNAGSVDATGAVVSDVLPAGLSFVNDSTSLEPVGAGTTGDAPILVSGLTISGDQAVTVTYQATATIMGGQITNTVSVTSTEMTAVVTDTAQISVAPPQYALNVTVTGDSTGTVSSEPAGINCGSDCTETYSYGTVVTLTASYDPGTTALVWGDACAAAVGDSCTLTIDQDQSVSAGFFDNTKPVLLVDKTVSDSSPTWGDVLTYTVLIHNAGSVDATGAVVSDVLPAGLSFVNDSTSLEPVGAGTTGDAPILVSGLTISGDQAVTVTYQATATIMGGQITNTVSVTSTEMTAVVTDTAQITVHSSEIFLPVVMK